MTAHEEARATTSLVVYEPPAVLNVQQAERRYELPRTGAVFVRQAWGSGDTGAAQWPAGVELAKLIDSEGPERWRGKRVLEISAGGGAVVAIALMRAGATVVATDADAEALKLHEENARANVEPPDVFASRYRGALVLRWGDDPAAAISALGGSPDVVVASDVAYPGTRDAWPAFARTLVAVGAGARILNGHASRYEAVDRRFFRVLREGGVRAERVVDKGSVAGVGLFELVVDS